MITTEPTYNNFEIGGTSFGNNLMNGEDFDPFFDVGPRVGIDTPLKTLFTRLGLRNINIDNLDAEEGYHNGPDFGEVHSDTSFNDFGESESEKEGGIEGGQTKCGENEGGEIVGGENESGEIEGGEIEGMQNEGGQTEGMQTKSEENEGEQTEGRQTEGRENEGVNNSEYTDFVHQTQNCYDTEDDVIAKEVGELHDKMEWSTMRKCRDFTRQYAINKKFEYRQKKNDNLKI